MKTTAEQVEKHEVEMITDAIGNCLELNDDFLDRHCGVTLSAILREVPESDREFLLADHLKEGRCNGFVVGLEDSDILLPCGEIEVQFEGEPEDYFENPSDFTTTEGSDLAYLYVGYGITIPVDIEGLKASIAEWQA